MIESFRAARWVRTLNLVLQAILFLTFVGGLNYLARSHAWRFDLTRYRRYTLSPETVAYLRNLIRPVQIVVTAAVRLVASGRLGGRGLADVAPVALGGLAISVFSARHFGKFHGGNFSP